MWRLSWIDYQPSMLREFSHFHPNILKIIKYSSHPPLGELKADPRSRQARNVSRWPLNVHDPISTWSRGKIVLIGDAAHPVSFLLSERNPPASILILSYIDAPLRWPRFQSSNRGCRRTGVSLPRRRLTRRHTRATTNVRTSTQEESRKSTDSIKGTLGERA